MTMPTLGWRLLLVVAFASVAVTKAAIGKQHHATADGASMSVDELEVKARELTHDANKKKVHTLLGHHHIVETPAEHRQYEIDMTLKTHHFQIEKPVTHHDLFKQEAWHTATTVRDSDDKRSGSGSSSSSTGKKGKKSTDKLVKDYLETADGDGEMFTEQGTGQVSEPTDPPLTQPEDDMTNNNSTSANATMPFFPPVVSPILPPVQSPTLASNAATTPEPTIGTMSPTEEEDDSKGKGKRKKKSSKGKDSDDSADDRDDESSKTEPPSRGPKTSKGDEKPSAPSVAPPAVAPSSFDITFAPTPTIGTNSSNTIVKRTLSAAAFEYVLSSEDLPTIEDLDELLNITDSFFSDMFTVFFETRPVAGFERLEVSSLIAHRTNFVEFMVDLYFEDTGAVPELAQLEEVARQQLGSGAEYRDLYLERLQESAIYGTTTLLLYVSDRDELNALIALTEPETPAAAPATITTNTTDVGTNVTMIADDATTTRSAPESVSANEDSDEEDDDADGNVTKIISPLAAFAGVLVVIGALVHVRRNRGRRGLDRNENLMKHTRDDGYYTETGTVSGNTYRTNAFSDDGTLSIANAYDDVVPYKKRSNNAPSSPKNGNTVEAAMDDVSLGDDARSNASVTSATHIRSNSNDDDSSTDEDGGDESSSSSVGTMIKAARETMTADAFKPKKSTLYDERLKPAWASRGGGRTSKMNDVDPTPLVMDEERPSVEEFMQNTFDEEVSVFELESESSLFSTHKSAVSEYMKQELSIPELLETVDRPAVTAAAPAKPEITEAAVKAPEGTPSTVVPDASSDKDSDEGVKPTEEEILTAVTSKIAPVVENVTSSSTQAEKSDSRPEWMKTQLKHVVVPTTTMPPTPPQSYAQGGEEPEWMQKFKQMGLGKTA